MEYTRLVLERAEAANKEVQIRILLELVDAMRKEAGAHLLPFEAIDGGSTTIQLDCPETLKLLLLPQVLNSHGLQYLMRKSTAFSEMVS